MLLLFLNLFFCSLCTFLTVCPSSLILQKAVAQILKSFVIIEAQRIPRIFRRKKHASWNE